MRWQITLVMIGKYKKEISMSHRHEKARNSGSVLFLDKQLQYDILYLPNEKILCPCWTHKENQ